MSNTWQENDALLRAMVGKRIEIPAHYDLWMQGARFGTVTRYVSNTNKIGQSPFVYVKMDHAQVKRRLKLWRIDAEYARIVEE
jgi:hypothetical protein